MAGGLAGLQGLAAQTTYAVPEENILSRSGGPADPRHGGHWCRAREVVHQMR